MLKGTTSYVHPYIYTLHTNTLCLLRYIGPSLETIYVDGEQIPTVLVYNGVNQTHLLTRRNKGELDCIALGEVVQ